MKCRNDGGKRRGMNMIELLGVMAVLVILIGIGVGNVLSGQEKARVTSAQQALSSYRGAFMQATVIKPAILSDRLDEWTAAGGESNYSSEDAFKRLVSLMNEALEDKLCLEWDANLACYRSRGKDPWGGHYILCEYPKSDAENRFNPASLGTVELSCSIWATGSNGTLLEEGRVSDESYGVGLVYSTGMCVDTYSGFDSAVEKQRYTDYTIPVLKVETN